MRNVQIPEALFCQIAKYFLVDEQGEGETADFIKKGLSAKLDAMTKHTLYTQYKTAPTEQQREKARQEYLDSIGVPDDFRW